MKKGCFELFVGMNLNCFELGIDVLELTLGTEYSML
jgi:hypothetical protein